MAAGVSGLHTFGPDTGPEGLTLLDTNFTALTTALNSPANFDNAYPDTGAVNALTVTVVAPQVLAAYSEGLFLQVKVGHTNTITNPTLNVNSLGAVTIVNPDGTALVSGQLQAGAYAQLQYSATGPNWILVGGGIGGGALTPNFGSFTGTLTGCTTSPTTSVNWYSVGKLIVMSIGSLTGTSNTTSMSVTGLPGGLQPPTLDQFTTALSLEDNGANVLGVARVTPGSASIVLSRGLVSGTQVQVSSTGFTASGTKGCNLTTFWYFLL
jgi:hypothetical protein